MTPTGPNPIDPGTPDALIGPPQAARILGVHRMTLVNWIKQGRLPAIQYGPGSMYRLRRGDVLAFVEASRLREMPDEG